MRGILSGFGFFILLCAGQHLVRAQQQQRPEYLWYEAENMRGISRTAQNEPVLNPSWSNLPREKNPGWGISGPGVSAEWSQGGESEWNSVAASADETRARLEQDLEVPRAGRYRLWVRYADWGGRTENFTARVMQNGKEILRHEFGARDLIDAHDETVMYWEWAFAWDASVPANLEKGAARLTLDIERAAEARRQIDCVLLTDDAGYAPEGRRKPDFAALKYLREWSAGGEKTFAPLIGDAPAAAYSRGALASRQLPRLGGRDFLMPCNIAREF
ncbi:MAG TPA: hypothetical protein VM870_10310, partial [Pyrinomonadaceae bacterium]|nr:hypothetical protein [Pyrinomonadaceae bacterium]